MFLSSLLWLITEAILQATLLFLVKLCLTLLCQSLLLLLIKTKPTLLMQLPRPMKCTQMSILSNNVSLTETAVPPAPPFPRYNLRDPNNLRPPQRYSNFSTRAMNHHRYRKASAYAAVKKDIVNHITPKQALKKFRGAAIKSKVKEIAGILSKDCFNGEDITKLTTKQKKKFIRSSMFLKEKYQTNGSFKELKARLVAEDKYAV
jgi:hypothetical protein